MNIPDYAFQLSAARLLSRESNVRLRVIGESRCKRKIICLQIGKSAEMPLIAAGFHGMEYLTVLCALRFANEYAAKKRNQGLLIVPCVNPDGTEIALHGAKSACRYEKFVRNTGDEKRWQANARGVDINHNFEADWKNVKRRETEAGITRPAISHLPSRRHKVRRILPRKRTRNEGSYEALPPRKHFPGAGAPQSGT